MIDNVMNASKSDARLAVLLDEACECAQRYLIAVNRPKGFEGTGEDVTLREEFRDALKELDSYCKKKGYTLNLNPEDLFTAAIELIKMQGETDIMKQIFRKLSDDKHG